MSWHIVGYEYETRFQDIEVRYDETDWKAADEELSEWFRREGWHAISLVLIHEARRMILLEKPIKEHEWDDDL